MNTDDIQQLLDRLKKEYEEHPHFLEIVDETEAEIVVEAVKAYYQSVINQSLHA